MANLTQLMAQVKRAREAGDHEAADRLTRDGLAALKHAASTDRSPYHLTTATFPDHSKLTAADYEAICQDTARLQQRVKALQGELSSTARQLWEVRRENERLRSAVAQPVGEL